MFRCTHCGALNRVPDSKRGENPICGRCKAAVDASGAPQEVNAAGLARSVSASPVPVLVDFWAPWCQPCLMVAPIVEQVAKDNAGKLLTLKLNTEQEPGPAAAHQIRGIPTFILFRGGKEIARQSGALPRHQLTHWLESHLSPAAPVHP